MASGYILNPRIIFWGTPEFALPSLEALIKHGYKIAAVVTNPDEPAGRKNILTSPPVKVLAKKHKIPVFQPTSLKDPNFKKEVPEADLYVVAAYGKIIPKEIIDLPKYGSLNVHPSLLPRWRGPSPIQYTILQSDIETGVTIMKMDELMDHGPIVAQQRLGITNDKLQMTKITYQELHDQLAKFGADLLLETLPKWLRGEITPIPQDDAQATYSKILKKDDGRIDWEKSAEEIERMVRAFNPWPGTWTLWPTGESIYRIRIEEADFIDSEPPRGSPGYVWKNEKRPLLVKTDHGSLVVLKLTPGGKKTLEVKSFLHGYPNIIGAALI